MKTAYLSLICSTSLFATIAHGAERQSLSYSNQLGSLNVNSSLSSALGDRQTLSSKLGLESQSSLKVINSHKLSNGNTVTRYQQAYNGVPIWGDHIIVSKNKFQSTNFMTGSVVTGLSQDLDTIDNSISISSNEALGIVKSKNGHLLASDAYLYSNENSELNVFVTDSGEARYAYIVSYSTDSQTRAAPTRPFALIDAETGEILDSWEGIAHAEERKGTGPGGNLKTGIYHYGTDFPSLMITSDSRNNCSLQHRDVKTVNLNGRTSDWRNRAHQFGCYENDYKDGQTVNGAYGPLNDALYFGGVVFRMYKEWANTKPLRSQLLMRVHYGRNFENAFWNGSTMTFGDGQSNFYPLVSLDVVSHEVSHGFTEQNSGLVYRNQSGGINEAFSDIAGEAAKYFMHGENDYLVGASIIKAEGKALRYMCEPEKDGKSIGHANDYKRGMDVHHSSGVYNRAFCLLSKKADWGVRRAFEIFVIANQKYWTPSTDYNKGACGVLKAANDKGYSQLDVTDAFNEVGVACQSL